MEVAHSLESLVYQTVQFVSEERNAKFHRREDRRSQVLKNLTNYVFG
jgi:hypothetical protein